MFEAFCQSSMTSLASCEPIGLSIPYLCTMFSTNKCLLSSNNTKELLNIYFCCSLNWTELPLSYFFIFSTRHVCMTLMVEIYRQCPRCSPLTSCFVALFCLGVKLSLWTREDQNVSMDPNFSLHAILSQ